MGFNVENLRLSRSIGAKLEDNRNHVGGFPAADDIGSAEAEQEIPADAAPAAAEKSQNAATDDQEKHHRAAGFFLFLLVDPARLVILIFVAIVAPPFLGAWRVIILIFGAASCLLRVRFFRKRF